MTGVTQEVALRRELAGPEKRIERLLDENKALHRQVRELGTALLERPIPDVLPPAEFPDAPWAKVEPTPEHPDGIEPGLLIAAMSLDGVADSPLRFR